METKNTNSINKKTEYAFSAIMFFAPLIKKNIKTKKNLTKEDKTFINWFIKLWYMNIILLIISIILWIVWYRTSNTIIQKISVGFLIVTSISLIIWTIFAALNKNININNNSWNIEWETDFDKLLCYIPIYNTYLWYKNHQFDWDNSSMKCGIILRWILALSAVFIMNIYVDLIIFCINWIKISPKRNKIFNEMFLKNPEEIRGYVSGTVFTLFKKSWIKENIAEQKKQFEFLFKTDNKQIIFEYILLCLLCTTWILVWIKHQNYSLLIWNILIILRYLVMIIKRNHLPHLPIFKGITNIFFIFKKNKNE